jgi:GntR family transcriptional regulator/MocR family aminotransferase
VEALEESKANVLHITPSHHFPTGLVTPISRRYELLSWASKSKDRYIIEDDYDSEFRLLGKPIPALQSIDAAEKVIYINTFSKSLTSTIRISYMVLPKSLMERYNKELSFYSCTVSNFEQYTLAKFIEQGYLEKHINRMRNHYRNIRDDILENIKKALGKKKGKIMEEDAGLHFLLQISTDLTDKELISRAAKNGINISCLSQYYYDQANAIKNTLIINYSGVNPDNIEEGIKRLFQCF